MPDMYHPVWKIVDHEGKEIPLTSGSTSVAADASAGLRYVLVEGDLLLGAVGIILPVGRTSPELSGFPIAYIGDEVQCFICGDIKPIEKDGGPYRIGHSGEVDISATQCSVPQTVEYAYENDVIYCRCGKQYLQAVLAPSKMAKDWEDAPSVFTKSNPFLPQGWAVVGRLTQFEPNTLNLAAMGFDGVGGLGEGMAKASPWNRYLGGSFRLTNGMNAAAGQAVSIKYYPTGWTGGSAARIKTYGMGAVVGKVGGVGSAAVGFLQVREGYQQDGGTYGENAQVATGNALGGAAGGLAGGKAGAVVGAAIGTAIFPGAGTGAGAIIGGIIGSVGGGWLGGNVGAESVRQVRDVIYN